MAKFEQRWAEIEREAQKAIEKAVVEAATRTYTEIVDKTPVGDTSLWQTKYPPKNYKRLILRKRLVSFFWPVKDE